DHERRRRLDVPRRVPLALVDGRSDECIERHPRKPERRQLARGRDEHAPAARVTEGRRVAADEEHAVTAAELLPGQRSVGAQRPPPTYLPRARSPRGRGASRRARTRPTRRGRRRRRASAAVAHDRASTHLTILRFAAFQRMMEAVAVPPFERFYLEHRDVVFGFLTRRLGRGPAEDAFQGTFLRALRGWHTLTHGRHLRAWILTIAARVVLDTVPDRVRGSEPQSSPSDGAAVDSGPAYLELAFLADELPPTE